ncbi:MAG: sulfatase-like hydrolase/transferase, partial [Limisphaerales bacterium]
MLRPTRFLSITTALLLSCLYAALATPPPNILVILTDDQGRGDYSAFGTRDIQTPGIDRIFNEGMDLKNFRANSPVCSPTRAALMTGRYPDRVGVPGVIRTHPEDSWGYLASQATLLPQLLREQGYHTALVGKWHLGLSPENSPNSRGFDHFHGFLGDMMDDYWNHRRHDINYMRLNRDEIDPQGHATDLFTRWAVDYLLERKSQTQPWFLYLAYNAPHTPIQPPDAWLEKVRQREPQMTLQRAKLVALIEHMDAGIAKVLQTLDDTGMTRNTLVFFTSDNGGVHGLGANNGPWRSGKQHVYEGGL